jgi:hypothetical protein
MANIRSVLAHSAHLAHTLVKPSRFKITRSWPAMSLLLIAPGIVTVDALTLHSEIEHASGLNLDVAYAPVTHLNQPSTLTLSTMSVFGTHGHFSLRIGGKLEQNFSITSVTPKPLSVDTDRGETVYTFTGGGKNAVTLTVMPHALGRTAATIQYGLDPPVPFSLSTVP